MSKTVTACLIVIGNEILSGRTREANLQYLGARLNELGIRLAEARIIPDNEEAIVEAVNACRAAYDYVFTTGGIGPTHDDITSACVAKAFGLELERNAEALAMLKTHYKAEDINPSRLRMADIPRGAALIENPVSKAPGYQIENVIVLAGVPRIMQAMFEGFRHRLAGGQKMLSASIASFIPEGNLAAGLAQVQAANPDVEIGSYPFVRGARLGVSVVLRCADGNRLAPAAAAVRDLIRTLGGEPMDEEMA